MLQKCAQAQADLAAVQQKYDLVSRLLAAKPSENEAFERFKKVFNEDFMAFANKESSLADEATAVQRLQALEKRLEQIVAFPHMFAKRSIAIGGGFSSGKSEFVNSFIAQPDIALPVGIQPVTAIPSYVMASEDVSIKGYTRTGAAVDIARDLYAQLSHDSMSTFSFNLKDQMPSIAVEVPLQAGFEHICLIDTPGYDPAGGDTGSDKETAINSLRDRDALIWMIDVGNGTIPQNDLEFLHAMELDGLPLYVVLNKADNKSPSELKDILAVVKDELEDAELEPMGIGAYSSLKDERGRAYPSDGLSLSDFFRRQNQPVENLGADLKAEFQSVFSMYEKAIEQDEQSAKLLMERLEELNLDLNEEVDADVAEVFGEKIDEIKQAQGRDFAPIKQELGRVKQAMFAAVKQVLLSLVDDPKSAAELNAVWQQQGRTKRHSQAARPRQSADTQSKDARDPYALHQVAKINDFKEATALLAAGANPHAKDKEGCTPLHWAAEHNALQTVKVLLAAGADPHAKDKEGYTPLHSAASADAHQTAQVLLDAGADPHAKDKEGDETPLHSAAVTDAHQTAAVLLAAGANPHAKDKVGYTPLYYAAMTATDTHQMAQDAHQTAAVLLAAGANPHAKDKVGYTPLYYAAMTATDTHQMAQDAHQTAAVLLAAGANPRAKNKEGFTPLHIAVTQDAHQTAQVLLAAGADPHARDKNGATPLHFMALADAHQTSKVLLNAGADLHAKDNYGCTPLHFMASADAHQTAQVLLAAGADPHAKAEDGATPLHRAAWQDAHQTAKVLLDAVADPHAENKNFQTPLHYAAWQDAHQTAQVLLAFRADPRAKAEDGATPLDYAVENNAHKTAQLLRASGGRNSG